MKTLLFFESTAQPIPQSTAWYLADLGEYRGKQELYSRQAPQKQTEMVHQAVFSDDRDFTVADLEKCPAVSRDMIRTVLKAMQKKGKVECVGRGPGALWKKKGTATKRGQ